jgi:arginine-tRNA-protein transferase
VKPLVHDQPTVAGPTFSHWPACPAPVRVPLTQLGSHPCPYLPGREASDRAFLADSMPPELYHGFMDRGFRRSGKVIYQPACRGCRSCTPVRVRVADFTPTRSLRRCRNRNVDLRITEGPLVPDEEKFELYRRYQQDRHGETGHLDWQSFVDFLYDSPVDTREFAYRDPAGRLLAVGICDLCKLSLSSVYFFYDPALPRRSLGTFGVLHELEVCRGLGIPFYYLGFWVDGCRAMAYKTTFEPYETLGGDGVWRNRLAAY